MPTSTAVLILLCIVIALVVMLFIAVILLLRRNNHVQKLTYPVYDYVVKKAEHEADALLKKAHADADSLLANAQKEGSQIIGSYTKKAEEAHRDFADSFSKLSSSLEGMLAETKDTGGKELHDLFARAQALLKEQESAWHKQSQEITSNLGLAATTLQKKSEDTLAGIDARLEQMQKELEASLQERIATQDTAIADHLKEVMKGAEAEIESYKKARLQVLDTHIERLIEDVVRTVLHTELTSAQHGALAREALEEARKHNLL